MGLLDKLLGRENDGDGLLTDDEKELREYEETEYAPTSRVEDSSHAEFIVEDSFPMGSDAAVAAGTVTAGTFHVGDKVVIESSITGNTITSVITGIEQYRKICRSVSEGDTAGLKFQGLARKDLKRNDIIKKASE